MIEDPPVPNPLVVAAVVAALALAQLSGFFPLWLGAAIDVALACMGSYILGLLSERKRRYREAIEHREEMIRTHRATAAFLAEMEAELDAVKGTELQRGINTRGGES